MGADSPAVSSVEHAGFTFSGTGAAEAVEAIKADDKARAAKATGEPEPKGKAALSDAASKLGKQGGKAAAEARAAKQAETEKAKPANTETEEAEAEPEQKAATSEDDEAADLDKHPRAKARVEEKAREAKAAREEAQREREARIRLEARLEALERSGTRSERVVNDHRPAEADSQTDEPDLDAFLAKHGAGNETKALKEWVSERDKWRDGQRERQTEAARHFNGLRAKQGAVYKAVSEVTKADPDYWPAVQDIAEELVPTQGVNVKTGEPFHIERPGPMNWLADELHDMPEKAPDVMKYLSENRDDLATIKNYRSERDVVRAVALIVAHTGRATAGEPRSDERQASKPASSMAPPPVRPVTGAPSSGSSADPMPREGESFDAWNRRTGGKKTATR